MTRAPKAAPPGKGPQRPGMLFHPDIAAPGFRARIKGLDLPTLYGTKIAGLELLPHAWVPPYVGLPAWLYEEWIADHTGWVLAARDVGIEFESVLKSVSEQDRFPVIVRSSGVGEGLNDRGRYVSVELGRHPGEEAFPEAVNQIFVDFGQKGSHTAIGLCIQRHIDPTFAGHLSNEVHLSASRNQWKYGFDIPFTSDRGLNSKFAPTADVQLPLAGQSRRDVRDRLRSVGRWVNQTIDGRAHLEWCAAEGRLWIVQIDQESPTSAGVDPRNMPHATLFDRRQTLQASHGAFALFRVGDESPWGKLRNVRDFKTANAPPHELFFASGDTLQPMLESAEGRGALETEIDALTGGRAVLRTDCTDTSIRSANMPRTHTVDGKHAVEWMQRTLRLLRKKGATDSEIVVILHRYIPARAAAWTYFNPGEDIVYIDCLWGLPDGLQFLSHDSYQIHARTGKELAAEVRYKPGFIQEQPDGDWTYVQIARQHGRRRVLSRESLKHLALETVAIAGNIGEPAQIMGFCDIPTELNLGRHLPWFKSKDYAEVEAVARPELPTRHVNDLKDLADIEASDERCILLVSPIVKLIRDDDKFLDRVAKLGKAKGLPVELVGSVLGHAYYRLKDLGVMLVVPQPKFFRVRGRQRFNKVVRDAIPRKIEAQGERASTARLNPADIAKALIAKLFEEGLELNAAFGDEAKAIEELADLFEVVRALAQSTGVPFDQVARAADAKRRKRGGFEQKTVLLETTGPKPTRRTNPTLVLDETDPVIPLGGLGAVDVRGSRANIPLARLLDQHEVTLTLDLLGRACEAKVSLGPGGLAFGISDPQDASDATEVDGDTGIQLELFRSVRPAKGKT
jgi:predicted house-cleaning noncanonical NTP pyrophosphatase (MazG superfamily)